MPDLIANSLHNNHYPSYFLLLWLVAKIGTSQWLLRLPSALFGALGADLTCAIGRRAAEPAQRRRRRAVDGVLAVRGSVRAGGALLHPGLLPDPDRAVGARAAGAGSRRAAALPFCRDGALRGAWLAYGLGTAAALDVLNVAVPWLVAANLGAIADRLARAGDRRRAFLAQLGRWSSSLILAAWLPLLAAVYVASKGAVLDGAGWAPAATAKTIWSIVAPVYLLRISSFITFGLLPAVVPGLSLAVARVGACCGAWRLRRDAGGSWRCSAAPHCCCRSACAASRCSCRCWCRAISRGVRRRSSSLPAPASAGFPAPLFAAAAALGCGLPGQSDPLLRLRDQAALGSGGRQGSPPSASPATWCCSTAITPIRCCRFLPPAPVSTSARSS